MADLEDKLWREGSGELEKGFQLDSILLLPPKSYPVRSASQHVMYNQRWICNYETADH